MLWIAFQDLLLKRVLNAHSVTTMEPTSFDKFIERNAEVEHGDLGVGDPQIKPSAGKRSEIASTSPRSATAA